MITGAITDPTAPIIDPTRTIIEATAPITGLTGAIMYSTERVAEETGSISGSTGRIVDATGAVAGTTGAVTELTGIIFYPTSSVITRPVGTSVCAGANRECPPFRTHSSRNSTATSRLGKAVTSHRTPKAALLRLRR